MDDAERIIADRHDFAELVARKTFSLSAKRLAWNMQDLHCFLDGAQERLKKNQATLEFERVEHAMRLEAMRVELEAANDALAKTKGIIESEDRGELVRIALANLRAELLTCGRELAETWEELARAREELAACRSRTVLPLARDFRLTEADVVETATELIRRAESERDHARAERDEALRENSELTRLAEGERAGAIGYTPWTKAELMKAMGDELPLYPRDTGNG